MTRVKVSEAAGPVLDWMVAEAMKPLVQHPERFSIATFGPLFGKGHKYPCWGTRKYSPSTDWSQGGPIIDREGITTVRRVHNGAPDWWATTEVSDTSRDYEPMGLTGPTPLVAAMRCFVASRLGDEVDVPEELV